MLEAQGDLGGALQAYRASLAIAERLAAADPSNTGWQRDVWVACWNVANVLEQLGDSSAGEWWQRSYETLTNLERSGTFISPSDRLVLDRLRSKLRG